MDTVNDSRINPRVPLEIEVNVKFADRREVQLQSENISMTGIMIAATQQEYEMLSHLKNPEAIKIQPELLASFSMPRKATENLAVNAQCRAIHIRRMSQNKYLIGLKFLQLNQTAASAIQHYIDKNLA